MKICIVVPMFNEEAIARESVETILSYSRKLPPEVMLVVVNDGSADHTEEIVREATAGLSNKEFFLISHSANRGYGGALRTGIDYAAFHDFDYVMFMDSDLTNHPKYLTDFYKKMEEGWDYIKATRYAKGGKAVGVSWKYRVISKVGNIVARRFFGLPLTDITNGFRAVKVEVLKRMSLQENGFAIIVEELSKAKYIARTFTEIPYVLTSRQKGQGTTRFSYTPRTCMRYLLYALRSRPSRNYSKLLKCKGGSN